MAALAVAQPQETVRRDAALEGGVELVLDQPRNSEPVLASACAMKQRARPYHR